MNIANWLYSQGKLQPHKPALFCGTDLHANYSEFAASACALGAALRDNYAIKPGDCVALYAKNRVEYLILMYAAWWVGAVIVPINSKLHAKEVAWILDDADVSLVCTDDGQLHQTIPLGSACKELAFDTDEYRKAATPLGPSSHPVSLAADTLAWLFYTSGTTGRPKGVMLSHNNLIAMSLCYPVDVDDVSDNDSALYAAPMSHGAGLYNFIHVRSGAKHVVPDSHGFDSDEVLALADHFGSVTMFAAPTIVKRLVARARTVGHKGTGIKTIICGGAPMYAADFTDAFSTFGARLAQIYGQGECPMTITAIRREALAAYEQSGNLARLASVGTAHSCVDVRIVDHTMTDIPAGQAGEIVVRGATVMLGYWRNEAATKETLVDGWLKTGDIGYLDDDGFLTLTDRIKDVIISGGSNIYPREVEEVLTSHSDVFEVAVIGQPHPDWGEEVVAFVVANPGVDLDVTTLDEWCKGHIAPFKRPKRYHLCTTLPKNSYGKVLKTELRTVIQAQNSDL